MNIIKAIIVDDEPKASKLLQLVIEDLTDDIDIVKVYNDPHEALTSMNMLQVDVLFLDIQMPGMNGFELLSQLKGEFSVVFVTGYDNYALEALQMAAVGYILKPIDEDDLLEVLNRVRKNVSLKQNNIGYQVLLDNMRKQNASQRRIGIPSVMGIDFVTIGDIISCEGVEKYTKVYLDDGTEIMSSYNLGEFTKLIGEVGFYQVHRSHLVNMNKIRQYQKDGILIMNDNRNVPVARRRKDEFLEVMNTLRR